MQQARQFGPRPPFRAFVAHDRPRITYAPPGTVLHVTRIGLRHFEPGDYELQVTVTDRMARTMATRAVAFTIG
jgi:hypothetical protein